MSLRSSHWQTQRGTRNVGPFSQARQGRVGFLPFFPNSNIFVPSSMDVFSGNGTVPATGSARLAGVNIYIAGVFMEGHRSKITASDGYTHLILADPGVVIIDPYHGNSQTMSNAYDTLAVPAGQILNWWMVRMAAISNIPGFGRRLLICADRFGLPGSWTNLI